MPILRATITLFLLLGGFTPSWTEAQQPAHPTDDASPKSCRSLEDLQKLLGNEYKSEISEKHQFVKIFVNNDLKWNVFLSFSADRSIVWIDFPCQKLPENVTAETVKNKLVLMLKQNWKIGPVHFALDESSGLISLLQPLSTEGLSSHKLVEAVKKHLRTADETQPIWNMKPLNK